MVARICSALASCSTQRFLARHRFTPTRPLVYFIGCGHFRRPTCDRHMPIVPAELAQIIDRLLAKNPERRYQSAADVVAELRRVEQSINGGAAPARQAQHKRPSGTLMRRAVAIAVLVATVSAVIWYATRPILRFLRQRRNPQRYAAASSCWATQRFTIPCRTPFLRPNRRTSSKSTAATGFP